MSALFEIETLEKFELIYILANLLSLQKDYLISVCFCVFIMIFLNLLINLLVLFVFFRFFYMIFIFQHPLFVDNQVITVTKIAIAISISIDICLDIP